MERLLPCFQHVVRGVHCEDRGTPMGRKQAVHRQERGAGRGNASIRERASHHLFGFLLFLPQRGAFLSDQAATLGARVRIEAKAVRG